MGTVTCVPFDGVCGDFDESDEHPIEFQRKRSSEIKELSRKSFESVSESVTLRSDYHTDSDNDDESNIYATDADFEDESVTCQSLSGGKKGAMSFRKTPLTAISESHILSNKQEESTESISPSITESYEMMALRRRHTSKRITLTGKDKNKPRCFECGQFYHIQSDPINCYDGVGITCDLCGKNKTDNPELLMDDFFYKCEGCESVDICTACYNAEKEKIVTNAN